MADYFTDINFEGNEYADPPSGEFENCTFTNCAWSGKSLYQNIYTNCRFIDCDLSNIRVSNTTFTDTEFTNCKMMGIRFDECNEYLFSAQFTSCRLDLSSFFGRSMKRTPFNSCSLKECDFTNTDLFETVFDHCDMTNAIFENTNLAKCDFRTAEHFILDPEKNRLKNAIFSVHNVEGLLVKYQVRIES